MDTTHAINSLSDDLDSLVERYRQEYDLTFSAVIGALQMKAFILMADAQRMPMESRERTDHVSKDLDALVWRHRKNNAISDAAIVGVLTTKAFLLMTEAQDAHESA